MMLNRKCFALLSADTLSWKVDFKGVEALHNIVINIDDQLLCSNVQTEVRQMYDELRRLFETFQRNVNKVTLNVKR
jgi:hypothetical protein